jgi:hypothetical protein
MIGFARRVGQAGLVHPFRSADLDTGTSPNPSLMTTRNDIQQLIYSVVDEVNAAQGPENQIAKRPDSILFGTGGHLDSLGLLTFVLGVEQRMQSAGHASLTLTDEQSMADVPTAFRSIDQLTDYLAKRIT